MDLKRQLNCLKKKKDVRKLKQNCKSLLRVARIQSFYKKYHIRPLIS